MSCDNCKCGDEQPKQNENKSAEEAPWKKNEEQSGDEAPCEHGRDESLRGDFKVRTRSILEIPVFRGRVERESEPLIRILKKWNSIMDEMPPESEDVRMAMSSMGEDSEHVAVNIPKDLAEQIMKLCAKEDITRSVVFRACIVLGLPILESLPNLASTIDPGGKRCPSNSSEGKSR